MEAVLDNVRSGQNVGSILRSAEALGIERLYLAGITPTPVEGEVRKASLGAEGCVRWSHHNNGLELARRLQQSNHSIWVLENLPHARRPEQVSPTAPKAPPVLIVGNEVTGVDPGIVELADEVICLPMRGHKTSFNAAVAFALAVYALTAV